jgi:hypothetical protein
MAGLSVNSPSLGPSHTSRGTLVGWRTAGPIPTGCAHCQTLLKRTVVLPSDLGKMPPRIPRRRVRDLATGSPQVEDVEVSSRVEKPSFSRSAIRTRTGEVRGKSAITTRGLARRSESRANLSSPPTTSEVKEAHQTSQEPTEANGATITPLDSIQTFIFSGTEEANPAQALAPHAFQAQAYAAVPALHS